MKLYSNSIGLIIFMTITMMGLNFPGLFPDPENIQIDQPNKVNRLQMEDQSMASSSSGDFLGFYTTLQSPSPVPYPIDIISFPALNGSATTISNAWSTISFTQVNFFLPTNTSAYNLSTKELVCLISGEQQLLTYQDNPMTSNLINLSPAVSTAPVYLNNTLYGIDIENGGYASGAMVDFDIISIDQQTGLIDGIFPGQFTSLNPGFYTFDHESMSSTSNGIDEIYFLSGTNLITVTNPDSFNPTYCWMDLEPANSPSNFYKFYGLEYRSPGKLMAIRETEISGVPQTDLVEIDFNSTTCAINGIVSLYDLQSNLSLTPGDWIVNSEYYSTTYNACADKYYFSTRYDINTSSRLVEINIPQASHFEQILPKYLFGIEWKKINCPCIASFSFQSLDSCQNYQFTNSSSGPGPLTYLWNFGDPASAPNNTSGLQNPSHQFSACGTFNVCLTIFESQTMCDSTICHLVNVQDLIPPVALCNNGFVVALDANCIATITPGDINNGSFDNCLLQSISVSPNTFIACGQYPVTLTVTDWCGNTAICMTTVEVVDTIPPIIVCPPDMFFSTIVTNCDLIVNGLQWISATDNCGAPLITYNITGASSYSGTGDASGLTFNQGISSVTYTATDGCGNKVTCNFTVTVICSPSSCDQQCLVNSINVSTGYNPYFGISQPGQMDAAWSLISAPLAIAPLIGPIPRPSFIIGRYGNAWSNTGALWISPYQFNNFTDFNCMGQTPDCATCEPFVYEREFCLCDDDNVTFNISFLSDDAGSVELWNLNGASPTLIKSLGSNCSSAFANNPLVPLVINTIETLPQGQYSIRIKHWNFVGEPMGINLQGTISGLHLSKETCCNPIPGGFYVNKFEDTDCNGIHELNVSDWTTTEQGLSGWTFTAINTSNPACSPSSYTAVTNAQGQAFFLNTCFGTYAISESLQTGWTPTSHPTGTQFPIDPPQQGGLQVAEFGNCGCTPGPNLIINADFSAWNSDFTSDYIYGGVSGFGPGVYAVASRGTLGGPFSCFDHATGLVNLPFLAVDASLTPGLTAWRQVVPIAPSTSYSFSAFVNNLFNPNSNVAEPIVEVWMVDGNNVGTLLVASQPLPELPDVWIKIVANWISPPVLVAPYKIEIRAGSTVHIGNDFAVDDISFQSCTVPRTSICENFNNVYIRSADGALDQSLSCGANPVQLECPGAGSEIIVTGRLDCDSGSLEQELYLEWELIRLPDSSIASGRVSANHDFGITLAPWYFNLPGSYVLQVAERADPDARCLINFNIDCPDLCPCDDLNFQSDVERGFASMISNIGCKACFAPIALNNCDQVNWYTNNSGGVPFASSSGSQSVCYNFQEPGIYTIFMEAYRFGSSGSSCETFTKSFPISLTCTTSPTCTNSIMPNSEFSEGAKAGGFNSGGGADGWMAPWGDPHEILGSDGSLDGFSVSLSGNASASDVLTTMEVICIPKDTGTITFRGTINTSRSNIKTISLSLDVDLPGSGPCLDSSCMTIAIIDLSALESPVTDSSEWYEFSIPYDIRAWNLPSNCGFNGTEVRPSIYVTNPLTDDLGDDTKTVFEVDRFCLEDETVSTKGISSINRLNIYPNPTTGDVNIELSFPAKSGMSLQVISLTGQRLLNKKAESGSAIQHIDASVLPQGMYLLQIVSEGRVLSVNKFVKQ